MDIWQALDKFLENLIKVLTIVSLLIKIWRDLNSKH